MEDEPALFQDHFVWPENGFIQPAVIRPVCKGTLVLFALVDQHGDQDQRKGDDHPVLKRDAEKRDLLDQPVVHRDPLNAMARRLGRVDQDADMDLTRRPTPARE